eukprot:5503014-Alexandrium_andersonii.AAC.1
MVASGAGQQAVDGWLAFCRDASPKTGPAAAMGKAAEWLAERAQTIGLRTTSLEERARAVGLGN